MRRERKLQGMDDRRSRILGLCFKHNRQQQLFVKHVPSFPVSLGGGGGGLSDRCDGYCISPEGVGIRSVSMRPLVVCPCLHAALQIV